MIVRIEKNINNENRRVKELNDKTNLFENYSPRSKKKNNSLNNYFIPIIKRKEN